ncbi:MAG TPA: DUF4124 domain-containing protein [Halioglobus sp.]
MNLKIIYWGDTLLKRALITCALVLTTTGLILSSSVSNAGKAVYRWTDENGNPVNSDLPPPQGTQYEVISTSSSMVHKVEDEKPAAPTAAAPAASAASNGSQPVEAQKPAAEKDPEHCARAKDNLAQLDTHARIRLRDDKGEVRYLSEEEKTAEREKAEKAIEYFCD